MTGEKVRKAIVARCQRRGLLVFHSTDPLRDVGRGFVDLFICGPGGMVFWECKGAMEPLSKQQTEWRWNIINAGGDHRVIRPVDLETGMVEMELDRINGN